MEIEIKNVVFCKKNRKVFSSDSALFDKLLTHDKCPACSSANFEVKVTNGTGEKYISMAQCIDCLHYFYSRVPDPANVSAFYGKTWNTSTKIRASNPTFKFAEIFQEANIPVDASILDVGCGVGGMIRGLREKGFSSIAGHEISESRFTQAKFTNPHDKIVHGGYDSVESGKFDVVYSNHVLEHVPHPLDFLKHFERALKPDGVGFISVPNSVYEAVFYKAFDFSHLHSFSYESLKALVESYNLSFFFIRTKRDDELTIVFSKSPQRIESLKRHLRNHCLSAPSSRGPLQAQWTEFISLFSSRSQRWTIYPPPARVTETFYGHTRLNNFQYWVLNLKERLRLPSTGISFLIFKFLKGHVLGLPISDQEVGWVETQVKDRKNFDTMVFRFKGFHFLFSK